MFDAGVFIFGRPRLTCCCFGPFLSLILFWRVAFEAPVGLPSALDSGEVPRGWHIAGHQTPARLHAARAL